MESSFLRNNFYPKGQKKFLRIAIKKKNREEEITSTQLSKTSWVGEVGTEIMLVTFPCYIVTDVHG